MLVSEKFLLIVHEIYCCVTHLDLIGTLLLMQIFNVAFYSRYTTLIKNKLEENEL